VALPELPDDRRVHPRRYGPADPATPRPPRRPAPPRNGRGTDSPTVRAPRRPVDDEPTESFSAVADDPREPPAAEPAAPEATGTSRRRRQLGSSPTERPASSYQAADDKSRPARSGRRRRPSFWRELPILVVVALVLTFLIQTFLAKVYVIPSGSMETTLHGCTGCVNDRVLVDKITYRFRDPQPGDVVVFRGPDSWRSEFTVEEPASPLVRGLQGLGSLIGLAPPDEKDFVKRVIAVGGQTIACCDPRNRVLVDNQPLEEPYIYYLPDAGPARQAPFGPITVPEGELWMMGDSRNNSADSRVPGHGAVPITNVIGQARLIVMPFDRFGTIAAVDPQTDAVGMAAGIGAAGPPVAALALLAVVPALRRPRRESFLDTRARPPARRRRGT
jgi:signal peptidase I